MSSLLTWRNLAILLLLANAKALPGAWTIRIIYYFLGPLYREVFGLKKSKATIAATAPRKPSPTASVKDHHPLFESQTITTHAPLLEIDYNLHKSNSTYFIDLDASRTTVVTRVLGWPLDDVPLEINPAFGNYHKKSSKARPAVILGAVHTSFKREIPAYIPYQVRSRILAWDTRWIYIGSWFLTTKKTMDGKTEEVILASALSKYIVKKGRITMRPEAIFRTAGWLPDSPADPPSKSSYTAELNKEREEGLTTITSTSGAVSAVGTTVKRSFTEQTAANTEMNSHQMLDEFTWSWDEIEKERLRGMDLVGGWTKLDGELEQEFALGH